MVDIKYIETLGWYNNIAILYSKVEQSTATNQTPLRRKPPSENLTKQKVQSTHTGYE